MPDTNNDKHQNVEQNLDRISEEEQETIIKDTDKLIEEMTRIRKIIISNMILGRKKKRRV